MDAAGILKPALSRGEIQLIGATTLDDYRKSIEKDAALSRRFQPVMVEEPDDETTFQILQGLRHLYEEHHHLEITDEALREAVRLSRRYIQDRFEPDKAIDLMDEAASRVRMRTLPQPLNQEAEEKELTIIREQKQEAIDTQDYEKAATLRSSELRLSEKIQSEKDAWEEKRLAVSGQVTADDIAQVVALWTGIPANRLNENESEKLLHLEDTLHARVVRPAGGGQRGFQGDPPGPGRPQGPEAADGLLPLPRADRRRQDGAVQSPGRGPLRRRKRDDPPGYVRIHGKAYGGPDGRLPARLRGL